MNVTRPTRVDVADLERRLQAADPRALLVLPRLLRRVIKFDRNLTTFGLQVPHHKTYVISREKLLAIVDPYELGLEPEDRSSPAILLEPGQDRRGPQGPLDSPTHLGQTVFLIQRPDSDSLSTRTEEDVLLEYWRYLYHARVHHELESKLAKGELSPARVRERVHRIGRPEFDEIWAVLRHEDYLLPPRDETTVYVEFAAVYTELRHFRPDLVDRYFPTIDDRERVDAILSLDLDSRRLLGETRPIGAPHPDAFRHLADTAELRVPVEETPTYRPAPRRHRRLIRSADRARSVGNVVRSAIRSRRAAHHADEPSELATRRMAHDDLRLLAERLREALDLTPSETERWSEALTNVLEHASLGFRSPNARILYDLQKVCLDHEREIFTTDLVEWGFSLGSRPIKRALPSQRDVLIVQHLRAAARRLNVARMAREDRLVLAQLLREASEKAETRLRDRFRPTIGEAFEEVEMKPRNLPERVALKKIVEELLDRIVERGFLTMGDLRDSISRNKLKLPDLDGGSEFVFGDRLLRIDHALSIRLDGVYGRGEFYLRWLQSFSSLAFGTPVGRTITQYVAIPFGGAYVALKGLEELIHHLPFSHHESHATIEPELASAVAEHAPGPTAEVAELAVREAGTSLINWSSVLLLGLFLFGMLHYPPFRRVVFECAKAVWRLAKGAVWDLPKALVTLPAVARILGSRSFLYFVRYAVKPLLVTAMIWILVPASATENVTSMLFAIATYLAFILALNSFFGRIAEEIFTDSLVRSWRYLRIGILPGLYRWIMGFFEGLLEAVDRFVYTVDEWLRFRSGESSTIFVFKAGLGLIWYMVTYVVRLCVILFIEPTINPIKHFPVVTVAGKILLSMSPVLFTLLEPVVGAANANVLIGTLILWIPGFFGFVVWELKENWRLYEANRRRLLEPVMIGSHGETMQRFMKPGFHSGTLPKLYARLRRAERKAYRTGKARAVRKAHAAMHHVEVAIRRFMEREFLAYLELGGGWEETPVEVGEIQLGSNRVRIELRAPRFGHDPLWISFEERSGWLVAGMPSPGWAARLTGTQRETFLLAVLGLYKKAGVDLTREQIEAVFDPSESTYDFMPEGLVIWTRPGYREETFLWLEGEDPLQPRDGHARESTRWPRLSPTRFVFRNVRMGWGDWVDSWKSRRAPRDLLEGLVVFRIEDESSFGPSADELLTRSKVE